MASQSYQNTQVVANSDNSNTGNYSVSVPNWGSGHSFTSAGVTVHKVLLDTDTGNLSYEDVDPDDFTITQGFYNGDLQATYNFTTNHYMGYRITFNVIYDDGEVVGGQGDPMIKTFDGKSYRL